MSSFLSLIQIFRPLNLLLGALAVIISAAILGTLDQTSLLIRTIFVVVTLNAAANTFNDYMDFEADKINRPNRPLPKQTITPTTALISSIILFASGIIFSISLPQEAFIIVILIAVPLMVLYSIWFKGWILIGNFVVSFILGLTFIFAGAAFGNIHDMRVPALLAFGFTMIRELIKDIADIEGDRMADLTTFPIRFGMKRSIQLSILFIVLLAGGTLIPFWLGIYGFGYLIILILGIEIPLFYVLFLLMKYPSIQTCRRISQILKACIFAGLLAVYLG